MTSATDRQNLPVLTGNYCLPERQILPVTPYKKTQFKEDSAATQIHFLSEIQNAKCIKEGRRIDILGLRVAEYLFYDT